MDPRFAFAHSCKPSSLEVKASSNACFAALNCPVESCAVPSVPCACAINSGCVIRCAMPSLYGIISIARAHQRPSATQMTVKQRQVVLDHATQPQQFSGRHALQLEVTLRIGDQAEVQQRIALTLETRSETSASFEALSLVALHWQRAEELSLAFIWWSRSSAAAQRPRAFDAAVQAAYHALWISGDDLQPEPQSDRRRPQ